MARYVLGFYAAVLFGSAFPWGTLFVNVSGSFLIGVLVESFTLRWNAEPALRIFLVVGICGGYTTFSAFSLEVMAMISRGALAHAAMYIAGSVVVSLAALYAGLILVRRLLA